jgi:hypothetical protein
VRGAGHADWRREYRPSPLTVTAFTVLFAVGIAKGAVEYARRPQVTGRHVAGTNAILIHVCLAVAAAAIVAGIQARRSRQGARRGPAPWAAPFSASALARLGRTVRLADGLSPANAARMLAAVPLVLVLAYVPARMGVQVTGGLDPNATVNAWGGPTYLGAMLAHWLDAVLGFYAAGFLLSRVLLGNRDHAAAEWFRARRPGAPV